LSRRAIRLATRRLLAEPEFRGRALAVAAWSQAHDSAGNACKERLLEIRRDGRRIPVPLLYTGSLPKLINDSTMETPIWLHCRPGNLYRVNLHTGYPTRVQ
jgi:hypothetical protein